MRALLAALVAAAVLSLVVTIVWFFAPQWCPGLVIRHSPFMDPVLRATLANRHYQTDQDAIERLRTWPGLTDGLIWGMHSSRSEHRAKCVELLHAFPDEAALSALLNAARTDPVPEIRGSALMALVQLQAAEAIEPLDHADPATHRQRVLALAELARGKDRRALPLLLRIGDRRGDPARLAAIDLLGHDPDPARKDTLAAWADQAAAEKDDEARLTASMALSRTRDARAFDHLVALLAEGDDITRLIAARGLTEVGDRRGIPLLITAARGCADAEARETLLRRAQALKPDADQEAEIRALLGK